MVFGEWGKIESQYERKNDNDYLHAMSLLFFLFSICPVLLVGMPKIFYLQKQQNISILA